MMYLHFSPDVVILYDYNKIVSLTNNKYGILIWNLFTKPLLIFFTS
jgi:hypothetical protein